MTVALIEAGDDPDAVSDFNAYRAQYGLAPCDETTEAGCLTTEAETGGSANPGWSV